MKINGLSVRSKIIVLLVLLSFLFAVLIIMMKNTEVSKLDKVMQSKKEENLNTLNNNLNVLSDKIRLNVFDNSYWDDMVTFTKVKNKTWAYDNIYHTLSNFDINIEYILDDSFNTIICLETGSGITSDTLPLTKSELKEAFSKNLFCSFFVKTRKGLVEIYGAPIQPSADYKRLSKPYGYLIAGIYWSDTFLLKLSKQTEGVYTLKKENNQEAIDHTTILNIVPLKDWQNKPITYLYAKEKVDLAENLLSVYNKQFIFLLLFSLLVISSISYFLYYYVFKPINILYSSVSTNKDGQLALIKKSDSEFYKLANTLSKFFEQRKSLVEEIDKRVVIEKELEEKVEFENMVSTISTIFINVDFSEIDTAINHSLSVVGTFLQVDRTYVFIFDKNKEFLRVSNFWKTGKIDYDIKSVLNINVNEFPWLIKTLSQLEPISISNLEELDSDAKDAKEFAEKQDIKSIVFLPLFLSTELMGFVGFDTIRLHKKFSENEIKFCRNVGIVLSNAFERKTNEEKITKSNIILENSSTILIECRNTEGLPITYVSKNVSMFGYTAFDIMEKEIEYKTIIFPADYPNVIDETNKLVKDKTIELRQEYRIISKSNNIFWVESRSTAISAFNNDQVSIESLITDISEKKKIEEALRQSEYNYRSVVNNIKEVIFQTDRKWNFVFLNPAWTEITGFNFNETIGEKITSFVYPEDLQIAAESFIPLAEGKKEYFHQTIRFITKNKGFKWIELHARLIIDKKGNIAGLTGTIRDVTEKVASEEAMRIKDDAIHSSHNAVIIIDAIKKDFPIFFVNPAFSKITEYSFSETIGKSISFLFGTESPIELTSLVVESFIDGKGCEIVIQSYKKSGELFWNEIKLSPIKDKNNLVTHFVGILSDVSDRVNSEEEIKKSLEKEKELNELKSKFVSMISHEFRTPLTTIFSSTELLERYSIKWTEEKKQEHLNRIKKSADNLTEMLNYILTLNKADAGKLLPTPTMINLLKFCDDIVEEFQLIAGENFQIELNKINFTQEMFLMDEKFLRHILTNLLSNAIKYSPAGGKIIFDLSQNDNYIGIQITDHGIGIPAEHQPKIFETFLRADNVGNINGTGLGLSIVKKTVDTLGGTISFHSIENEGTTFELTIPIIT